MNKGNRHWLLTLCAAVALTAAMPSAAFADVTAPQSTTESSSDVSTGSAGEGSRS